MLREDGTCFPAEASSTIIKDKNGKPIALLAHGHDITERKKAESALRESENKYRTIFETTGTAMLIGEEDTTISLINAEFEKLCGYSKEEVEGKKSWIEFIVKADLERMKGYHHLRMIDPNAAPPYYEFQFIDKQGNRKDIFITLALVPGTKKTVGSLLDITERKRAEEELRILSSVVEQSTSSIAILDKEGIVEYVNPKLLELYEVSSEEVVGKNWRSWLSMYSTLREKLPEMRNTVLERGTTWKGEVTDRSKRGEVVWRASTIFPTKDAKGEIANIVYVSEDITERKRAEEALRASESEKKSILNAITDVVVFQDRSLSIRWVNEEAARSVGKTPQELVGCHCYELWHGQSEPCEGCPVLRALETGSSAGGIMTTPDGRWWEITAEPVRDIDKKIVGAMEIARDITEHKLAEEALLQSEIKYRTLVEHIPAITYIAALDESSTTLYVSSQIERIVGISPADYKADPDFWAKHLHPDDRERVMDEIRRCHESDQPFISEYRMVSKDGRLVWLSDDAVILKDDKGKPLHLQGVMYDITERKQAEKALRESEERYRTLVEGLEDVIVSFSLDGTILYCSPNVKNFGGYDAEEEIGHHFTRYIADEKAKQKLQELFQDIITTKKPVSFEFLYKPKNKEPFYVEATASPNISKISNAIVSIHCIVRDITERKRAEDLLRSAEQDWRNSFNSLEDVMLIIDRDYNIENISEVGLKLLGKSKEEVIGKKCYQIISGADSPTEECPCMKSLETKKVESLDRYEERFGKYFSIQSSPIFDENGEIIKFVDLRRDITERKQAAETLRESEERFRTIVEAAPSLLIITDAEGNNMYVSPNCEEITGYTQEELRGELIWWVHEGDTPRAKDIFERTFREGKGSKNFEYKIVKKSGEVRHVSSSWEPLKDEEGKLKGIVFQTIDITEHKQAEDKVKEAYRLREHFLKETSHRIITPVAIIGGNADLLLESSNLDDDQKEKIRIIRERNEEVQKLTRDALAGKYLEEEEGGGEG